MQQHAAIGSFSQVKCLMLTEARGYSSGCEHGALVRRLWAGGRIA